ncbi:MAG: ribose-phosphate pyrophosphokinase [Oscillospiraceae bacterium]|nr:ribose-phosphate pyrophosphokinase [Oscillospiraceae bacterium]
MEAESVFHSGKTFHQMALVPTEGSMELAKKIDKYLVQWSAGGPEARDTFIIDCECPRFQSGDGKGLIKESVRGKDLYFVVDVGNYNIKYKLFGNENSMSPDDHYQDLKRLIQAASGKASRMSVIMPILYGGRQHRRSYRESLDCAFALQELHDMGIVEIITFDAHDNRVQNAIPLVGFDNLMPHYQVLKKMFKDFPDLHPGKENFMVVSPDEGAMNRNMYYSSVLGCDLGMFYKRRDYSVIVNGRNPIVAHEYLGAPVEGKSVIVVDDMIASGDSMLDIAKFMHEKNAGKFFAVATYGLFTNGLAKFDKAYEDGLIHGVFCTNLTYRTPELLERPWFHEVDCSKYIAYVITAMNHDISITEMLDPAQKIKALMEKYGK